MHILKIWPQNHAIPPTPTKSFFHRSSQNISWKISKNGVKIRKFDQNLNTNGPWYQDLFTEFIEHAVHGITSTQAWKRRRESWREISILQTSMNQSYWIPSRTSTMGRSLPPTQQQQHQTQQQQQQTRIRQSNWRRSYCLFNSEGNVQRTMRERFIGLTRRAPLWWLSVNYEQ